MISWEELKLASPSTLVFGDGTKAFIRSLAHGRPLSSRHGESALIQFKDQQIGLDECIDTSPNYDAPWILVIRGHPLDRVLLFGGEVIYLISSHGEVLETQKAFRTRENAQFWRTETVPLDDEHIAIVYEVGVLSINTNLNIVWHVEKALIDFFDHLEPNGLVFLRDHETPFTVNMKTGEGVPPGA